MQMKKPIKISPLKGRKLSEETKRKMSEVRKGRRLSIETRLKLSLAHKGKKFSDETRKKMSISQTGKKYSQEYKDKMSAIKKGIKPYEMTEEIRKKIGLVQKGTKKPWVNKNRLGPKNWAWKGGISKDPYPPIFNNALRLKIRTRDNFTCCLCGITEEEHKRKLNRVLSVNHIDFNKNNCEESNLNTLCVSCNSKINGKREYYTYYFKSKYEKTS